LNKDNFETFLVSSLFTENDLNWWFDFLQWNDSKLKWDRIPYYVFDYASSLR